MLVLSRKKNEQITIGNNIHVEVLAIDGGRVRLGLTVPQDVQIRRGELLRTKEATVQHVPALVHARRVEVEVACI